MNESTRRKASGRFQATLNAQNAPEEEPPMPRRLGSELTGYWRGGSGGGPPSRKPRGGAADAPQVGIGAHGILAGDLGQQLLDEKPRVALAERVVLEAAVVPPLLLGGAGGEHAGVHEEADGDGHVALGDEVVEHDRDP